MDIKYYENNNYVYGRIENCLDENEINSLRDIFNYLLPNLQLPEDSGAAIDENGKPKKKNLAYFLHETRPIHPLVPLLEEKYFRSIEEANKLLTPDSIFNAALSSNWSGVLLSYYNKDDDGYKPHRDNAAVTCIMWFDLYKKNFTGGDLYLPQPDVTISPTHNTGVIIPGYMLHEVKPVTMIDKNNPLGGRTAISIFCGNKP